MKFTWRNIEKGTKDGIKLSLFGFVGWGFAIILVKVFDLIFKQSSPIDVFHFVVIPSGLLLLAILLNYVNFAKALGFPPRRLTAIFTVCHGFWALFVGLQINNHYNGYFVLFLFSFGQLYLKSSYGLRGTLVFSVVQVVAACSIIWLANLPIGSDDLIFLIFFVYNGLTSAYANELNRIRSSHLKKAMNEKAHSYEQLQKIVFPHQIEQIAQGRNIESTLPSKQGFGCCLLFEIIESQAIKHEFAQECFRKIFGQFSLCLRESYDLNAHTAKGYRIVELNDRFVCTVGFPFSLPHSGLRTAEIALDLADQFIAIFEESIKQLDYPKPIRYCISIAAGELEGFFTQGFPIEYHVYGPPLSHAEHLRDVAITLPEARNSSHSLVIIPRRVYESLTSHSRTRFAVSQMEERTEGNSRLSGRNQVYFSLIENVDARTNLLPKAASL
jgi:hypothetical protein